MPGFVGNPLSLLNKDSANLQRSFTIPPIVYGKLSTLGPLAGRFSPELVFQGKRIRPFRDRLEHAKSRNPQIIIMPAGYAGWILFSQSPAIC